VDVEHFGGHICGYCTRARSKLLILLFTSEVTCHRKRNYDSKSQCARSTGTATVSIKHLPRGTTRVTKPVDPVQPTDQLIDQANLMKSDQRHNSFDFKLRLGNRWWHITAATCQIYISKELVEPTRAVFEHPAATLHCSKQLQRTFQQPLRSFKVASRRNCFHAQFAVEGC
jgi:hypothetical protein